MKSSPSLASLTLICNGEGKERRVDESASKLLVGKKWRWTNGVLVSVVLKDELLEEEEGPLVVDLLSNLNRRLPHVLGRQTSAVRALSVRDDVLNLEDLLQNRRREDLVKRTHMRVSTWTLMTWQWERHAPPSGSTTSP